MATNNGTARPIIVINLYGGPLEQFTKALLNAFQKINMPPRYTLTNVTNGKTGKATDYYHLTIADIRAHNLILGRRADGGKLANKRKPKEGWVKPSIPKSEALANAIKEYEDSIDAEAARLMLKKEELSKEVDRLDDLAHFGNGSVDEWLQADDRLDLLTQQLENARVTWGDYGAIEDMVRERYNQYTTVEAEPPIDLKFPYTKDQIAWWEKKSGAKSDTHGSFKIWEHIPKTAPRSVPSRGKPVHSNRKPVSSKRAGRWRH